MNGFHLKAAAVVATLTLVGGASSAVAAGKNPAARGSDASTPRHSAGQNAEQLRRALLERLRREAEERAARVRENLVRLRDDLARRQREELARRQREEAARRQREEAGQREEAARNQRETPRGPVTGGSPRRGESVGAVSNGGPVTVRLPGSDKPVSLEEAGSVPVGTVVDARQGGVTITAASGGGTDRATFSGSVFQVLQPSAGGATEIKLMGGNFDSCSTGRGLTLGPGRRGLSFGRLASPFAGRASARRKPVRKLWAQGKGRFRTRGRNGSATVRGTVWMTADSCNGTLVKVKRGVVDVRDFARRRTVALRAGKQYLARARR